MAHKRVLFTLTILMFLLILPSITRAADAAPPNWLVGRWRVDIYVPRLDIPPSTIEFSQAGAIMTSSPARLRVIGDGSRLRWEAVIGTPDCGDRWVPVSAKVSPDQRKITYKVQMLQAVQCRLSGSYAAYTLTKQ